MAVEFSGDSVKLEMDSQSTQNSIQDKFKRVGVTLILLTLVSWQIATFIKVQNIEDLLQQESEKLRSDVKELNTFKFTQNIKQMKIKQKSKELVNAYLSPPLLPNNVEEPEDSIPKLRDDFLKYMSKDIYTNIGNFGYFFKFDNAMTFEEGKDACKKINGHLLEFDETHTNAPEFLEALTNQFGSVFWIGLTDIEQEGSFKWLESGKRFSNLFWGNGEPNNLGSEHCVNVGRENYVHYDARIILNDIKCTEKLPVVCEKNN